MRRKIIAALAVLLLLSATTTGKPPTKPSEISGFRPVEVKPTDNISVVIRDRWFSNSTPAPRPQISRKTKPIIVNLTPPEPKRDNGTGTRINGVASWYCLPGVSRCTYTHSGGNYAAIRRDLLFLRGEYINVCANSGSCVRVQIIDCNCGSNANLIDLYSDAFRQLAPLSAGVVKVYIEY